MKLACLLFTTNLAAPQSRPVKEIDQNIHYHGAGTQQPADIPNLKPAVSDFVREYLLHNSKATWVLNCLRDPSSCDKGKSVDTPPEARTVMPSYEEEVTLPDGYYNGSK